jgi:hypothetical protein
MTSDLLLLALLGTLAWLWLDSLKAHEIGTACARKACRTENLQLLDETVVLCALKLTRNLRGSLRLQRSYAFEYSITGNERLTGHVVLCGHELQMLDFGEAGSELPDLPED